MKEGTNIKKKDQRESYDVGQWLKFTMQQIRTLHHSVWPLSSLARVTEAVS